MLKEDSHTEWTPRRRAEPQPTAVPSAGRALPLCVTSLSLEDAGVLVLCKQKKRTVEIRERPAVWPEPPSGEREGPVHAEATRPHEEETGGRV